MLKDELDIIMKCGHLCPCPVFVHTLSHFQEETSIFRGYGLCWWNSCLFADHFAVSMYYTQLTSISSSRVVIYIWARYVVFTGDVHCYLCVHTEGRSMWAETHHLLPLLLLILLVPNSNTRLSAGTCLFVRECDSAHTQTHLCGGLSVRPG